MVYFIKSPRFSNDVDTIAKTMINIERNQTVFNEAGVANHPEEAKKSFNAFKHSDIEYDVNVSVGVIHIFSDESLNQAQCVSQIIIALRRIEFSMPTVKVPISNSDFKSTQYTMISRAPAAHLTTTNTCVHGESFRKIIITVADLKKCHENGSKFVWFVRVVPATTFSLIIPELTLEFPCKAYLMKSLSTIICDNAGIFNVANLTKQIDYPSLAQYSVFTNNKIVESCVIIGIKFGLAFEIITCYNTKKFSVASDRFLEKNPKLQVVDYNNFNIKRIDESKSWEKQLDEPFDYEAQERLEMQSAEIGKPIFPNDICFISRAPLYKHAYILKVSKGTNVVHIMVSPSVYSSIVNGEKYSDQHFVNYFTKKSGYSIIDTFITKFPRTEAEAIDLIPPHLITDVRRDLLKCIALNGCFFTNNENPDKVYTANKEKRIVYLGFRSVTDRIIMNYRFNKSVLFGFKFR